MPTDITYCLLRFVSSIVIVKIWRIIAHGPSSDDLSGGLVTTLVFCDRDEDEKSNDLSTADGTRRNVNVLTVSPVRNVQLENGPL